MKKPAVIFCTLFILCAFFTTTALAGDPIPGILVGAGKNPGGQQVANTKTGNDGRFTLTFKEGSYTLNLSYDAVQAILKSAGKTASELTLTLNAGTNTHVLVNDRPMPATVVITTGQRPINITVPAGGATISGLLTGNVSRIMTNQTKR